MSSHTPSNVNPNLQNIVVIGECMIELYGHSPNLVQGYAGDTLNTAVYLSRLLVGANAGVQYMTAIGLDPFSDGMLDLWHQEGIGCDYVLRIAERNPGIYVISVDGAGERSFQYWRGESAAKQMFDCEGAQANLDALVQFNWIYLSGISLAILPVAGRKRLFSALANARKNGTKVVFDNNFRPKLWPDVATACDVYDQMLSLCDLALLTFDDELAMRGPHEYAKLLQRCKRHNVGEVVIKRGAQACVVVSENEEEFVAANRVEKVVDTTAAGDSFSAGYLAARVQGLKPSEAALWGHKLAGTVIQYPGAIIPKEKMPLLE